MTVLTEQRDATFRLFASEVSLELIEDGGARKKFVRLFRSVCRFNLETVCSWSSLVEGEEESKLSRPKRSNIFVCGRRSKNQELLGLFLFLLVVQINDNQDLISPNSFRDMQVPCTYIVRQMVFMQGQLSHFTIYYKSCFNLFTVETN